jgi:four helix bundle protein
MVAIDVKDVEELNEVKEWRRRIGPVKRYTDLLVYQQSYRLALQVSKFTRGLPREEQFELGRQLRRCSRSVPANVVEGWTKRNSCAEFKRHLVIAAGEAAECGFWIGLAVDEGLVSKSAAQPILSEYCKLGFMIHNLWKEWRKL